MSELILGPFSRVEGDLEVRIEINDNRVAQAFVAAPLYRGFEQILQGRPAQDALVIAPRICGSCSVSQSVASAQALAMAMDVVPPANGVIAANLILACENAADHLTHFYLFFMPDFASGTYGGRGWHDRAVERFKAQSGVAGRQAQKARVAFLHAMGILAGKWPHNLAVQPGGTTKSVDLGERMRLLAVLAEFRSFLETTLFADSLENIAALTSVDALERWREERPAEVGDFRLFLHIAEDLHLSTVGRGPARFLSYGAFGGNDGQLFASGLWRDGDLSPLDLAGLREDLSHAWMCGGSQHPDDGVTMPDADRLDAYSWCKAPRLNGETCEVGAFARQMVAGHPLIRALAVVADGRASVQGRVVARLLELALLVPAMERWVHSLAGAEAYCQSVAVPDRADGFGLVEAARGSLGHWLSVEGGQIRQYQVVAPTTWNFSPRDKAGQPGPLEEALVGAAVLPGEEFPLTVQHVIRSFDPCMRCAVH
ncbi:nickel-dependent hydrogenase large subunit [Telmatospirillum sp.]|uniref:nickel-dependent hydrogenase large subunit n=1 Tax=Telmatospirillum sp. TaxID=2079197 RepID=UPI00283CEFB8|nr:nickel-dependent hydrogenase large subunit [Telmatospirillum sp.]MDR3435175.1 nickel-dependent hydrogenase large subunit [Telmatospirillum sp.]